MINNLEDYNIEIGKDGRVRAYNKKAHKVTSYPRLIMENVLNRKLLKTEDIHHKDGNPLNNDPENLEVIDHREHDRIHGLDPKRRKYNDKEMICPICGEVFIWTPRQQSTFYKTDAVRTGGPFCSKHCAGIHNQKIQAEKGFVTKYTDRIEICAGCGKPFLYTAKSQRDHRPENRDKPYCSIECVYRCQTKYTDEIIKEFQESLFRNDGCFAKTEREFGLYRGRLSEILRRKGLPYHKDDYRKITA